MVLLFGIGAGALVFLLERKLSTMKGVIMNEKATSTAKASAKTAMAVVGGLAVQNIQVISEKLLRIIEHIFTVMEPDTTIFSLIMDVEQDKKGPDGVPSMAMLYPETQSVVMFHQNILNDAIDKAVSDPENRMSMRAYRWYNILLAIFHEIHHSKEYAKVISEGKLDDFIWTDELENAAKEFAYQRLLDLAKEFDIEMPTNDEEPLYGLEFARFREALDPQDGKDDELSALQRRLYDEDIVASTISEAGETVDMKSFKEFLRLTAPEEELNDPAWKSDTTSLLVNRDKLPEAVEQPEATIAQPVEQAPVVMPTQEAGAEAGAEAPMLIDPETGMPADIPNWEADQIVDEDTIVDIPPEGLPVYGEPAQPAQPVNQPTAPPIVMPTTQAAVVQPQAPAAPANNSGFVNPVMAAINGAPGGVVQPTAGQPAGGGNSKAPQKIQPLNISVDEMKSIVQQVIMRLYMHIFTKCGFNPSDPGGVGFANPDAVYEPVFIGDIPNANKVFLSMDVTDVEGKQVRDVQIIDSIKGQVFSKSGLPGYWLHLNVGGYKMKRSIVPQNQNKTKKGQPGVLTYMAQKAREGWAVMWVISEEYDPCPDFPAGLPSDMMAKVECRSGSNNITFTWKPFAKK